MFDSQGGSSSGAEEGEEAEFALTEKRLLTEEDVRKFLGGQWPKDDRAEYSEDITTQPSSEDEEEDPGSKRRKVENSLAGFVPGGHFLEIGQGSKSMVMSFFEMILPPPIIEQIVTCTNQNAEIHKLLQSKPYLYAGWTPLTEPELKTFLGLLYHMENIRMAKVTDYWRSSRLYHIPIFQNTMTRRRFLGILGALSFNVLVPPPSEAVLKADKLYKIRPILDHLNNLISSLHCKGITSVVWELDKFGQNPLFTTFPWYRRLGLFILHILLELGRLIYNDQSPRLVEKLPLSKFRERVVEALLPEGSESGPDSQGEAEIPGDKPHYMSYIGTNSKGKKRRKRCKYCMDMRNKRKESYFCCAGCPNHPGFCIDGCFAKYHGYS